MQGYGSGKAADHYLLQRIEGASPEQLVAMLLEGGQRFLALALQAMKEHDLVNQPRYVNRVSDIIMALRERLNFDGGGELVENLTRIYDWWLDELFKASMQNQPERLQMISRHMGDLRTTWEELHQRKTSGDQPPDASPSLGEISI